MINMVMYPSVLTIINNDMVTHKKNVKNIN